MIDLARRLPFRDGVVLADAALRSGTTREDLTRVTAAADNRRHGAQGKRVLVRLTWHDIVNEPERTIARIRRSMLQAA